MADEVISQLRVGSVLRSSTTEYTILEFIGEGSFGKVAKCQVGITSKLVAVKILKNRDDIEYERQMLTYINFLNSDNVIKFYEHFYHLFCTCLVFELLEMDLFTFLIRKQKKPMFVYEIRPIAKQMLVALQGLVSLEVMHADIKPDNIMLANIKECAYRVKLIDFGLAIRSSGARQGLILQPIGYRAPEICLGLLYTESIDMWGLGCTLAFLYLTQNLFIVNCEYLMMKSMVEILGMPSDNELAFGMHSKRFFCQEEDELGLRWRLLTPEEYSGINKIKAKEWPTGKPHYTSLDELFCAIKKEDAEEIKDIRMFIDFLKKMLHLDGWMRITPEVALQHPFITMSHLSQDPDSSDYLTKAQEFMSKSELPLKDVVGQEDPDEERMAQLCPAAGQCEPTETDGSKHIFVGVQSLDSNSQWEDVETLEDEDEFEKVPFTPSSGQSEHIERNVSEELHLHSTEDDSEIQFFPEQFFNSRDETLDLVSSVNGPAVDSSDYLTKAHEFMSKSELPLKDVVGQEDIDEERMAQLCPAAGQCEPTETDGSKHIFVGVQSLDSNSQWEDVETLEDEDEFEKVPFTPSSGQSEHIERNVSKELHLHSTEDDSEIQFLPEQFFSSRDETLDLVSSVNGPVVEDVPRPTPTPKRKRNTAEATAAAQPPKQQQQRQQRQRQQQPPKQRQRQQQPPKHRQQQPPKQRQRRSLRSSGGGNGGGSEAKWKSQQAWREAFAVCRRTIATPPGDGFLGYVRPADHRSVQVPPKISFGRYQKLGRLYQVEEADVQGTRDLSLTMGPDGVVEVGVVDTLGSSKEEHTEEGVSKLIDCPHLTDQQQLELKTLLQKWEKVFAVDDEDFGRTDLVQHRIHTGDAPPIKERYRLLPPVMYKEIKTLLADMLEKGGIRESCSPWAAPIVLEKEHGRSNGSSAASEAAAKAAAAAATAPEAAAATAPEATAAPQPPKQQQRQRQRGCEVVKPEYDADHSRRAEYLCPRVVGSAIEKVEERDYNRAPPAIPLPHPLG
ncbi:uncharacterized protein LOC114479599 [Gouania willdenowi]|uniref:uncharacterized protein LOC114479599 n=1 Tax=Gouania willdenowi TaxID=441366 RepID=UPI001054919A|nr:uncharacterized protein LOC114479599 [Gouania willdenowi]